MITAALLAFWFATPEDCRTRSPWWDAENPRYEVLLKAVCWVVFATLQEKGLKFHFNQYRICSLLGICLFLIQIYSFIHTYKHTYTPTHAWLILIYHSHNEELFTGKDFWNKNCNSIPRILYCQLWLEWESIKQTDASSFFPNTIKYDHHISLSFIITQKKRFTLNPAFSHKKWVICPCQIEYGNIKAVSIFLP